jgi:hypothetical protein
MKILRIFLIVVTISLIASKAEKAKTTLSANVKKDNFSENPIAGVAVPNDNYILQQAEVNI